jgi:RNA polymerase sigma-70 factor (ECF subfamily)
LNSRKAFLELLEKQQGAIIKVCRVYSDDDHEFEDYFQEVTLQLWKSYGSFKGHSKVSTWVYRVALNVCLTQIKKKRRKIETIPEADALINRPDTTEQLQNEMLNKLEKAIRQLRESDRAIIVLYLEENSYQDIADILGITMTNVGAKLNRAKAQLKALING